MKNSLGKGLFNHEIVFVANQEIHQMKEVYSKILPDRELVYKLIFHPAYKRYDDIDLLVIMAIENKSN